MGLGFKWATQMGPLWVICGLLLGFKLGSEMGFCKWAPHGLLLGNLVWGTSGLPDLGPICVNSRQDGLGCKWAA
jgi:hypothetical protein